MLFRRIIPAGLLIVVLLSSCALKEETRTQINLLGTTCTLTVYARNPDTVLDKAFERIRDIDLRMKYTGDESEVAAINRSAGGGGVKISSSTLDVLERGLYYSRLGNGRFDVTIGPLVELWGIGKDSTGRVPSEEEITEVLARVDYRKVAIEGHVVSLPEQGMAVDLGGIAKGYAADEVAEIFRDAGVEHALINLGGNVYAYGDKPDGSSWRIGVQDPATSRGEFLGVVTVTDSAVVTSGPYERFFIQDGVRYHHILDTTTGFPVENGVASTTIVAENSMDADALSTLVFTLGPEKGIALIERLPGIEALVIDTENQVYPSSGVLDIFRLTSPDYRLAP